VVIQNRLTLYAFYLFIYFFVLFCYSFVVATLLANEDIGLHKGDYSATSNNMKLVHWPLMMGGLLHLVQRRGDWAGPRSLPRPLLSVQNVTVHPSTATVLLYNGPLFCGFNVPINGLTRTDAFLTSRCRRIRTTRNPQSAGEKQRHVRLMGHDIREIEHELNVLLQHIGLFIIQQSYGGGKLIARVGVLKSCIKHLTL